MRFAHRRLHCFVHPLVVVSLAALLVALAVTVRQPSAQKPSPDAVQSVQILGATAGSPATLVDRGATYYWLESQAARVTTRFPDAVAVSERDASGDLKSRVTDLAGNELATFKVDRIDSTNAVLDYRGVDRGPIRAASVPTVRSTLDWGNRQAYGLWRDLKVRPTAALEWKGDVMQPRGAEPRSADRDVTEVRTEWPGGITSTVVKTKGPRRHVITGARINGTLYVSRVTKDTVELGVSRWYVEEQALDWSFPGLTEGYVDASRLKHMGGWTFTPDLAWTNVQSFAFQHFHQTIADKGFVGEAHPGWVQQALGFVSPTLHANEPGCDGLHWLDGSLLRPCCDNHDRCYERYGCNASSWWLWWNSWSCTGCNTVTVFCFVTNRGPFYRYPF